MTKEKLMRSAAELQQPSAQAARSFEDKSERLAAELNRRMLARPDLEKLIGPNNELMMQNNSRNMIRFMGSLFGHFDAPVLVDTVLWVFLTYRSHGFQVAYWAGYLDTFVEILRGDLSTEEYEAIYPFFHWLIVNIPAFTEISQTMSHSEIGDAPPHG